MSKYLCVCGVSFDKKKKADDHAKVYSDVESAWPHQIIRKKWRGRFEDFILDWYNPKWVRVGGFLTIHGVFVYHFKYCFWESILSAVALGLII